MTYGIVIKTTEMELNPYWSPGNEHIEPKQLSRTRQEISLFETESAWKDRIKLLLESKIVFSAFKMEECKFELEKTIKLVEKA